ncbi:phosphate regulon sensor histidine kinase PhoR [Limnohabitans sp. yimb22184]|uniref:phosphate regulon sensor histidine kinase PhoR n=1 Tax=Limnohabitans sp. YIMB22184 TaxID=3374104 RepID=UPI003A85790D
MVLEILGLVLLVAVPAWFWGGVLAAALAVCALLTGALFLQIWKTRRLELWLSQPDWRTELPWKGVWAEIAQRIQRQLRQNDKLLLTSEQRLQYFLQAIQASPNGVTLLDAEGRIEWCNATASNHLGLDAKRDVKQHIVHLLRDPVFSRYFAQGQHDAEVIIDGRSNSLIQTPKLSVQLHAYGESQFLLLSRDITSVTLADAMRRDFVANVSHEIRTPLTVLSGFVETLQTIPLNEQERQNYLQLMSVQAERMQSLVADLLTLSQLEGSSPPGNHEQVPLPELMTQVAADAAALSAVLSGQEGEGRGPVHVLDFDTWADCALLGVRSELLSAISNLVSNAVRYTPAGGTVRAAWVRTAEGATFSVTDTGPGIAPEHLPRLSERFYRVDRSRSRETGGTGLGLAIAKHVVQRHGGELRIESQVGKGSTFMLTFPASRVVPLID